LLFKRPKVVCCLRMRTTHSCEPWWYWPKKWEKILSNHGPALPISVIDGSLFWGTVIVRARAPARLSPKPRWRSGSDVDFLICRNLSSRSVDSPPGNLFKPAV
jgi:hypothetical protein